MQCGSPVSTLCLSEFTPRRQPSFPAACLSLHVYMYLTQIPTDLYMVTTLICLVSSNPFTRARGLVSLARSCLCIVSGLPDRHYRPRRSDNAKRGLRCGMPTTRQDQSRRLQEPLSKHTAADGRDGQYAILTEFLAIRMIFGPVHLTRRTEEAWTGAQRLAYVYHAQSDGHALAAKREVIGPPRVCTAPL